MISCQDADVLAAALSVGSLDHSDEGRLQQHLARCQECRKLASEYMEAAARLPLALTPIQPSPELRGRLMRAVYAEAARAPARERERTATGAPAWWQRLWAGIPAARVLTTAGAAAAVALIAVTSWGLTHRPGASNLSVALVASPEAPNAHGQLVIFPSAHQAVLSVAGLPPAGSSAGPGSVYEVWLLRPDGASVAAAYLSQQPDGTWTAAMHGDMTGYAAVAATVEPAGGSLTPTGAKLVEGFIGSPSSSVTGGGSS